MPDLPWQNTGLPSILFPQRHIYRPGSLDVRWQADVTDLTSAPQTIVEDGEEFVLVSSFALMNMPGLYFTAIRRHNFVYVNPIALTEDAAVGILLMNNEYIGIFTTYQSTARNLATRRLGGIDRPAEYHGNGHDGYHWHYHPANAPNAHIWFAWPNA